MTATLKKKADDGSYSDSKLPINCTVKSNDDNGITVSFSTLTDNDNAYKYGTYKGESGEIYINVPYSKITAEEGYSDSINTNGYSMEVGTYTNNATK